MRPRNVLAFSISLILAAPVLAQPSERAQVNTPPKAGPGQPVFMPVAHAWFALMPFCLRQLESIALNLLTVAGAQ